MKPQQILAIIIILYLAVFYIVHTERMINQDKEIQELKAKQSYKVYLYGN